MLKSIIRKFVQTFRFRREISRNRNKVLFNGSNIRISGTFFEGYNMVAEGARLYNCYVGKGSYVNVNSRLIGSKIGNYCSIADNVYTGFGHHPLDCISTHPAFFYDTKGQLGWNVFPDGDAPVYDPYRKPDGENKYSTVIGNDVWIGSHVLIMDGVTIGDGAVIGAGSVVTKDVEPYAVMAGVPAKLLRYRHSESEISSIIESRWWTKDPDGLGEFIKNHRIGNKSFLLHENV